MCEFLQTGAAQCTARDTFWRDSKNPYSIGFSATRDGRRDRAEGMSLLPLTLCPSRSVRGYTLGVKNVTKPRFRGLACRPRGEAFKIRPFRGSREPRSRIAHFAAAVCKTRRTSTTPYGITLFHAVPRCMLHARCIGKFARSRVFQTASPAIRLSVIDMASSSSSRADAKPSQATSA